MTVVEEKAKFNDFSLSVKDMNFLSSKMGISPNKAKNLFEQKQDLDLILFQISSNKVLVRDFSELSFYPFCKFAVFHYSKKHNFTYEEKNYMADLIFNCYPKIKNEEVQINVSGSQQNELMAAYCLIIISFFDSLLEKFDNSKTEIAKLFLDFIISSYNNLSKNFISDNLEEWILILKKMKKNINKKCRNRI